MKCEWLKETHIRTPDGRTSQQPTTSIQIQNYSTSFCSIDNIDIEQFAFSNGTEGNTVSGPTS